MAKICPDTGDKVLYLDCIDCDDRVCQQPLETGQKAEEKNESIDKKSVLDTLRALEYGYSGYSINGDRLEGAYILASELTGMTVGEIGEHVIDA